MAPEYLTLPEAADYLGVSTKTLRRRISEGKVKAYRVGHPRNGFIRLRRLDVQRLLVEIPV